MKQTMWESWFPCGGNSQGHNALPPSVISGLSLTLWECFIQKCTHFIIFRNCWHNLHKLVGFFPANCPPLVDNKVNVMGLNNLHFLFIYLNNSVGWILNKEIKRRVKYAINECIGSHSSRSWLLSYWWFKKLTKSSCPPELTPPKK